MRGSDPMHRHLPCGWGLELGCLRRAEISLSHSFRKVSTRKIVEGSNYDTFRLNFCWFEEKISWHHHFGWCCAVLWLGIFVSDPLIWQISMLYRILRKFDILFEISNLLTEISWKFSWNWGFSARSEWSIPCSCGNDRALTLDPFERLLALRSAFGCPLFANCLCSHSSSSCFARFLGI